jgi:hypothetical protein
LTRSRPAAQTLATTFLIATLLVLVIDVALSLALAAVRVGASGLPWWVDARLVERSAWVVMALLVWMASRVMTDATAAAMPRSTAARLTGRTMIVVPAAWVLATAIVLAVRLTWRGTWPVEGRIFVEPYYYSTIVLTYGPWMLAGAVLIAASRHLGEEQ